MDESRGQRTQLSSAEAGGGRCLRERRTRMVGEMIQQATAQRSAHGEPGQRQRVWIAMVLAQQAAALLLDEPTTFLDIGHQNEVLKLIAGMRDASRTIVAVLHDINQAARFATHLIAMKDGRIVAEGEPAQVVTAELIADLFDLRARVIIDPVHGVPVVLPGG